MQPHDHSPYQHDPNARNAADGTVVIRHTIMEGALAALILATVLGILFAFAVPVLRSQMGAVPQNEPQRWIRRMLDQPLWFAVPCLFSALVCFVTFARNAASRVELEGAVVRVFLRGELIAERPITEWTDIYVDLSEGDFMNRSATMNFTTIGDSVRLPRMAGWKYRQLRRALQTAQASLTRHA